MQPVKRSSSLTYDVTEGTMPNEKKRTVDERRKYLRLIRKRYLRASKHEHGGLLDQMEAVTRLHRKSLIRLMGGSLERKPRRRQRRRTSRLEVEQAVAAISESRDHARAEGLQPTLVEAATRLALHLDTVAYFHSVEYNPRRL
jgi:hypothetical protein